MLWSKTCEERGGALIKTVSRDAQIRRGRRGLDLGGKPSVLPANTRSRGAQMESFDEGGRGLDLNAEPSAIPPVSTVPPGGQTESFWETTRGSAGTV